MASTVVNLLSGGLLQGISGLINTIRGKSPEDAAKLAELAAKYQTDLLAADLQMQQAQSDVNKVEAANSSIFVAGWRPAVGWVCASAFFANFVVGPLVTAFSAQLGRPVVFPVLDLTEMMPVLLGMLGLGGMRSWEKAQGVQSKH